MKFLIQKKVGIIIFLIVLVFLFEWVFLVFHKQVYLLSGGYCLYGAKLGYLSEEKVFFCLEKASSFVVKELSLLETSKDTFYFSALDFNQSVASFLVLYLQNIDVGGFFNSEISNLSDLYYKAALVVEESGVGDELIKPLLERCIALAPQLSYCYVELGNWHMLHNHVEKAEEVLNDCIEFYYPSSFCKEELEPIVYSGMIHEFGYLRETVENYYLNTR